MNNPNPSPSRSNTVNGARYQSANAQVLINPQGKPVAFRRVRVLQRGTFAGASRLQLVTPRKVVRVSRIHFASLKTRCYPLN